MDYQVVRRDSCTELEEAVNCFINQGWELVGGVAVSIAYSHYQDREDCLCSSETVIWAQAIKRLPSTEEPSL